MGQRQIVVCELSKTYRVHERAPGLAASLRSLVRRRYRAVRAVEGINFSVDAGEMVGFIGPNGAGKTTTLKMLSGLLYPTSGTAEVEGFVPWEREPDYLRRISMVLGNKSQLMWDIPPLDTFHVLGEIYRVGQDELRRTLDELIALLEIGDLLGKQVRTLSLGERMKCELVAALLHRPSVLFLDEPTLGLDVTMQARLRRFIGDYNSRTGATVILTSHHMADVVALCPRVMLIHQGRLLYDGELSSLAEKLAPFKLIRMALGNGRAGVEEFLASLGQAVHIVEAEDGHYTLRVGRAQAPAITARLLETLPVADISVEDPPIEAVIDQVYQEGEI
jgi:ABC-2 type transport system ATP-binding protein